MVIEIFFKIQLMVGEKKLVQVIKNTRIILVVKKNKKLKNLHKIDWFLFKGFIITIF